jgi:hypothetical protein
MASQFVPRVARADQELSARVFFGWGGSDIRAGGLIDQTDSIWTEAKFGLALGIAADALPHAGDASTVTTRAPIAREVTPAKAGKYLVGRHPQDQQSP